MGPSQRYRPIQTAFLVLFLAFALVWPLVVFGQESKAGPAPKNKPYAPGELLVKFKTAARAQAYDFDRERFKIKAFKRLGERGVHRIKLAQEMSVEEALIFFRQDPEVEYAEPNYYRFLARTPDDPSYASQWGLPIISAPAAWDHSTNCTATVVAVIDSGADYEHPDLAANIWTNPAEIAGDGIDNDGNGYIDDTLGWDFVTDDNDPMDDNGHSTHVAGTIAAVGNNARGVTGICWDGKIMALRAFDARGDGTLADVIEAMQYARIKGAKVVNASYAGADFSQAEYDTISLLDSAGILLIVAAGNEGADNDHLPSYPAGYDLPNIIAVAATDSNDQLASFSNFGPTSVHVAAPGVSVLSTYLNNDYTFISGTSMASPYVSGLAALVWSSNPGLSAPQVKDRILDCVDRLPDLSGKVFTSGRINANNSLQNIPAPPSRFAVTGASDSQIILGWDENYSDAVGIRIERRETAGGAFAEIALVAPGTSVYHDTGVQTSKTYSYRARAFNSDNASAYTSEISATAASSSSGGGGGGGGGGGCFLTSLLAD
jgi:subtilisin family serine protease